MKYYPISINGFQRENLRALAEYLDTGVTEMQFSMKQYQLYSSGRGVAIVPRNIHECGAVGCAAGHGPVIGIKAGGRESWSNYTSRVFTGKSDTVYNWCFSGGWTIADNTARGAAARIFLMLEKGVPVNFRQQMLGDTPLSYTVEPLPAIDPAKVETPVLVPHE